MVGKKGRKPPRIIWAYAYQIVPPQPEYRLRSIKILLADEHSAARKAGRTWTGRLVFDPRITHVLVVSDSPEVDLAVNRKLETLLKALKANFLITAPLAVPEMGASR